MKEYYSPMIGIYSAAGARKRVHMSPQYKNMGVYGCVRALAFSVYMHHSL